MNKKERILIFILASINFTHIMDFMIMMPLGPQLMRLFQISPQQFAFIVSAYTFSAGIASFFAAFFVDRFDRKKILLFGYTGFIIGTFACGFAPTYFLLVMSRILAGAFGGLIAAQVLAIVADSFPYEKRGVAMGSLMAAFSVASVAGVPFGLYIATVFTWHAPFIIVGSLGIIIIILVIYFIPHMTKHIRADLTKPHPLTVITNITSDNNQIRALLLTFLLMIGHFSIIPFIAPYMVYNVGFTEKQLTYIYLIDGAVSIFSSPFIGRMADRYGKYKVLAAFILLSSIPVIFITNMPPAPVWAVLIVTSLFFVFAGGRMIPVQAMVSSVVLPQQRGSFMSINSSLQQLAVGIASFMAGSIIHKSSAGSLEKLQLCGIHCNSCKFFVYIYCRKIKAGG